MKVYKFGGASVKNAAAIKNVAVIIASKNEYPLVVVVSAMDKTTNKLEELALSSFNKDQNRIRLFDSIQNYHLETLSQLIENEKSEECLISINSVFSHLQECLDEQNSDFDALYDKIVACGELLSTILVYHYLKNEGFNAIWLDARDLVSTDKHHRAAKVNWHQTYKKISNSPMSTSDNQLIISQGFIGRSVEGHTTTLGREGSDYSAAIFAHCLDAEEVILWKDVPGIFNADPKSFPEAEKIDRLTYYEATEMTNCGAKVIHPKTMRPLEQKDIPLMIASFGTPHSSGTRIGKFENDDLVYPPIIVKTRGIELLSLSSKDFSPISEQDMNGLFALFEEFRVKVQLMQIAFLTLSIGVLADHSSIDKLIEQLDDQFKILRNSNLELATIRHYQEPTDPQNRKNTEHHPSSVKDKKIIREILGDKELLLEQRTRTVVRLLYR